MIVNGNLKFHTLGAGELQNAIIERLATAPTGTAGRIYYNTADNTYYFHNGTQWVSFATGGNAAQLENEINNIEASIGSIVDNNGVWVGFTGTNFLNSASSITNAFQIIDSYLNANNELAELDDVQLTGPGSGHILYYHSGDQKWKNKAHTLGNIDNVADGVDSAAADDILMFKSGNWTNVSIDTALADADLEDLGNVTFTAPASGHVIYYNGTQWVNAAPGATSGVQGYDPGLQALAVFNANGILVQTSENNFAARSLVAPAQGITITNADGVSGNPTFALANDLAALEGLTTTGYIVRTGDGTAVTRSIDGNAGRIVVTNNDGVNSNTNIDLATVTQGNTGSFVKVTIDTYGRVSGNTPVVASDITALVDSEYVNASGDTMTGTLTMSGAGTHIVLPNPPTAANHAANKAYVDSVAEGLEIKPAVEIVVTSVSQLGLFTYSPGTNGVGATLTANNNGAFPTIDGVTLTSTTPGSNGVLIAFPATSAEAAYNGRYNLTQVGNGSNPWVLTRCGLCDESDEIPGSYTFVKQGTQYAGSGWVQTVETVNAGPNPTQFDVGYDKIRVTQFSGAGAYTAGVGLSLAGNQFNVNLGAGIVELPTDEVGIDLYSPTAGALILTTDGSARSTASAARLHLLLKAAGGLTQDVDGLYIPAGGVTNAMLANSKITLNADAGGTDDVFLGETILFAGNATQGIETTVSGNTITIAGINAGHAQKGVASFQTSEFSITAGHVSLGTVPVNKLSTKEITIAGNTGSDPVGLGETFTITGSGTVSTNMAANTLTISWSGSLDSLSNVSNADNANTGDLLTKTAGDWQPISRATLFGSQTLDSLSDVTVTHSDGAVLVSDGTNWVAQKVYFLYTSTAPATSHTVTHNLGVKYCNVTVVDSATDEVVIPQSIVFDTTTSLTVTFNTAVNCRVIVMGVA